MELPLFDIEEDNVPMKLSTNTDDVDIELDNDRSDIAMFMNTSSSKHRPSKASDIDSLENELNDIVSSSSSSKPHKSVTTPDVISNDMIQTESFSIGKSMMKNSSKGSSSEYGKIGDVTSDHFSAQKQTEQTIRTEKEIEMKKKFDLLNKIKYNEKKGAKFSKNYTINDPIEEMQSELTSIEDSKRAQNNIKMCSKMMLFSIKGIEALNGKFNPFDVDLDGWGENVEENITDYDDIFAELQDELQDMPSVSPLVKLILALGGSAVQVHLTNTMFKTSMPAMDDVLRQHPDIMRSFQAATIDSMKKTNPNFSNMMMPQQESHQSQSRGEYVHPEYAQAERSSIRPPKDAHPPPERSMRRPEMKGPTNIEDILAGVKTTSKTQTIPINASSTISVEDIRQLPNGVVPKKSRKNKSAGSSKNSVSIDL